MDFEQFVGAHLPALVRYAAVLAGERDLAHDVVQDALVRAHARWRRIGAMDRPEHYVRRMVTTEYLSWRRRRARRAAALTRWAVALTPGAVVDHAEGTVQRSALNQQLATLPAKQRAVLVLGFFEGLADPEIAELLGCSPGSVRTYRSRALAVLRTELTAVPTGEIR
ncbi:MAG TPA: SigE family RNA polymerase sigma factor [Actinophytocola sp.]|uniref:SigE family RNA polymerase sigma factor n=1 Tax=Actinophytocola sp. TaxID=1872138 RepID=UPI002DDD77B5|nr:SigE family RNA polymerase sigma factor [Actinophytocola sp.]HEV2779848.1 SigE family RNA polymerase sigma factor [Actinophytocola sp.]